MNKSKFSKFVRTISVLAILLFFLHGVKHCFYEKAVAVSTNGCFEPLQYFTDAFLMKYGDRYAAFAYIHYFRDIYNYRAGQDAANQYEALGALYAKYPDMQEQYLYAIVEGILDEKTNTFMRNNLIGILSDLAGEDFERTPCVVHYEYMGPYEYDAVANIVEWWKKRSMEKLAAAQAVMKKDSYYAGEKKSGEKECVNVWD